MIGIYVQRVGDACLSSMMWDMDTALTTYKRGCLKINPTAVATVAGVSGGALVMMCSGTQHFRKTGRVLLQVRLFGAAGLNVL